MLQELTSPHALRNEIQSLLVQNGIDSDCFIQMLDYTIELFETQGLGTDYYGYHNINHELEVTYVTMLVANRDTINEFTIDDLKYLYVAALFHDFDPQKSVDKPHEQNVIKFISSDKKLRQLLDDAKIDIEIIKVLIHRTTYPWRDRWREDAEIQIMECFRNSTIAKNDTIFQDHVMYLGAYLSVIDRLGGYSLGDFSKAMDMAKMNAHALGWKPSLMVKRAVEYFEELLGNESDMSKMILRILPKPMRKNFFDTVLSFMKLRQQEIKIQADVAYENLKLLPTIENTKTRRNPEFIKSLHSIFRELPKPLQFGGDDFEGSIKNMDTILTTLRLDTPDGEIIGFAKGGALEEYKLRPEITDENHGKKNTIFLEPIALKRGYWGLKGGSEMRHMFVMLAHAKKYKYMTSFALRDVVKGRVNKENAEFVVQFDPERWDYYRVKLEQTI